MVDSSLVYFLKSAVLEQWVDPWELVLPSDQELVYVRVEGFPLIVAIGDWCS